MARRLGPKQIESLVACYSELGDAVSLRSRTLQFRECHEWRNPTISPIFPRGRKISKEDLVAIEKHFARVPRPGKWDVNDPYVCLIEGASDILANRQLLRARGWKKSAKQGGSMIFWSKARPVVIPKGFTYRAGAYADPTLHRDFWRSMKKNFGTPHDFAQSLDRMNRTLGDRLRIVVIYRGPRAVASGLVVAGRSGSYLYCGSVDSRFRRRGLWNLLVAARQSISNGGAGHAWAMLTRNPALMKRGSFARKMTVFTKLRPLEEI